MLLDMDWLRSLLGKRLNSFLNSHSLNESDELSSLALLENRLLSSFV